MNWSILGGVILLLALSGCVYTNPTFPDLPNCVEHENQTTCMTHVVCDFEYCIAHNEPFEAGWLVIEKSKVERVFTKVIE